MQVEPGLAASTEQAPFYLTSLQRELERRCERNPRYSLRSFARSSGLSAGTMSRLLTGKRVPSFKLAQKLLATLDLTPDEQTKFIDSLGDTQRSRDLTRVSPVFRNQVAAVRPRELSIDLFRIIADYYHYAILELTFADDFESSVPAIAKRLGLGLTETGLAVERLKAVGLLEEGSDGRLRKTEEQITTADKSLTTPALRRRQKQVLEKAVDSLENDPIDKRSMTAMTMTIDPDMLPVAKKMIEEFTQRVCAYLESGKRKKVYEMSVALFPLEADKGESK